MDSGKTESTQGGQAPAADGARRLRPQRRIAKQLLDRGRRLRKRIGMLIGASMGVVALLTVME